MLLCSGGSNIFIRSYAEDGCNGQVLNLKGDKESECIESEEGENQK